MATAAAVVFAAATVNGQVVWTDDLETYAPGSGILGQGGWTAWGDDPTWDSLVTDAKANSGRNSLDVVGNSDSVYRFNINHGTIDTGQWIVTAKVFIPADMVGADGSYFILMSEYDGNSSNFAATQVRIDPNTSNFVADFSGETLPLIFDTWFEFRVEIDLDNNTQEFYIADELLFSDVWTQYITQHQLQALDLFANGSSSVYYDDLTLAPAQTHCLDLHATPLVGGDLGIWTVTGLQPNDRFVVVWSTRLGQSVIRDVAGYCATFGIRGINRKRIVGESAADANGVGTVKREIPLGRAGLVIYTQAAKRFTCPDECTSNIVESIIQ